MATSNEFITTITGYYVSALESGLSYNLAYDLALINAAKDYQFTCEPLSQELKMKLVLTNFVLTNHPPELQKMISLFGTDETQKRITEIFVSCLDGTLILSGFDEIVVNSIISKILSYIDKNDFYVRLICDSDTPSMDPCRVSNAVATGKNVRFMPPTTEGAVQQKIEAFLSNSIGTNIEVENLSTSEVSLIKDVFLETLNVLYNNNQVKMDPNSQEVAVIIDDVFSRAETSGMLDSPDLVVLMTLLNSTGQVSRMSSSYTRLQKRLSTALRNSVISRTDTSLFTAIADNSGYSILLSNALQFKSNVVSCNPNKYPSFPKEYKIETTCDCATIVDKCNVSFIANVVTAPVIYEVPYFYATGKVTPDLPTPPDIQFFPYKDVDNLILINLNTTAGKYSTKFVPITNEDTIYLQQLASSRGVGTDGLFTFVGDSQVLRYEAFRTEEHPKTFSDFAMASVFSFTNEYESYSNAISQVHSLQPNKKYYYIFRTIDINNNISNPSKIYEIEMINNGGAILPAIRTVDFKKDVSTADKAEMRRMLLLSPAKAQVDIYSATVELVENYQISSARDAIENLKLANTIENPIWGKKFKIRITSLDTGRMLDVNLTPTVSVINPAESCPPTSLAALNNSNRGS